MTISDHLNRFNIPGSKANKLLKIVHEFLIIFCVLSTVPAHAETSKNASSKLPNIVIMMADDQGWGETSFNGHPYFKTPNIDAMASKGAVFNRFYAYPTCSPTRASILTGRHPDRAGVLEHGFALRHQEQTLAEILSVQGYATGHFGKWHLSGIRGLGLPVLLEDAFGPDTAGFQEWVSSTNYFDDDPILGKNGAPILLEGDSSEVITEKAIEFMHESAKREAPFFSLIWFGAPHTPWRSKYSELPEVIEANPDNEQLRHQHGEIIGIDNSVGMVRQFLADAGLANNTLVLYLSDNGSVKRSGTIGTAGLRGHKSTLWEGGIRVPAIVEWPDKIQPISISS